ncbi:MAG TPA: hypothetical protein EYG39_05250, partial [Rhodothermales bacterium]|nr:hypothetical protein [Rhodothermales bacterium]
MDKQDDRRTLQDILSVYRTLGMMHAASEMTRATQHLNYAGVSYDILPIKDGLEFLLEGMLGSLNLRPSKIKEIADSIETHFNESRPEGVLAMMEFHDRASNVYFEEARLRSYQLEKPERGDCADEDEYNDRLEDWKLEHKVWMDLKN